MTVKHAPQQPFAFAGTNAQMSRQRPGEFNDAMIQERRANFERDCHRGAVDLLQNIVRQIGRGVEQLHALKEALASGRCGPRQIDRMLGQAMRQSGRIGTLAHQAQIDGVALEQQDLSELLKLVSGLRETT
jgi:hypothetical protein